MPIRTEITPAHVFFGRHLDGKLAEPVFGEVEVVACGAVLYIPVLGTVQSATVRRRATERCQDSEPRRKVVDVDYILKST